MVPLALMGPDTSVVFTGDYKQLGPVTHSKLALTSDLKVLYKDWSELTVVRLSPSLQGSPTPSSIVCFPILQPSVTCGDY